MTSSKAIAQRALPAKVAKALQDGHEDIAVGDVFIDRDGRYLRIDRIELNRWGRDDKPQLHIQFSIRDDEEGWRSYGEEFLSEFKSYHGAVLKVEGPIEEFEKAALAAAADPNALAPFQGPASDETALIVSGKRNQLETLQAELEEQTRQVERVRRVLAARTG
jgi:hypothetical protein